MRRLCFAGLFIFLYAAVWHSASQPNDPTWITYTAEEILLTFDHPPDWHPVLEYGLGVTMSNLPGAEIGAVPPQPGEIEFDLLLQSIPSLPPETRPLDLLPEFVDTSVPESLALADDRSAVMVQHNDDEQTQTWIVWLTDDERLGIVHFSTAADEAGDFLPDVRRVIESMQFIEPQIISDYLESLLLDDSLLGRTYESESLTFDYPTVWQAEDSAHGEGVILLTQSEHKSASPKTGEVNIQVRVHASAGLNSPYDVLDRMSPFERAEFYPLVEFALEGSPALRANLQWGGPRILVYIIELDTHVYAEIRADHRPLRDELASIDAQILAMAATMRYSWG